ncbi:MAG: protein kinase [Rhodothalassiaceae bacterium]
MLDTIGRYEVVGQLGSGAMADVYEARDPSIGRHIAVKVMKPEMAADQDLVGRFLREARAAGCLNHPNIVTLFDFGEFDDKPFIAMELVRGQTLEDVINNGERVPLDRVLSYAQQLASALEFAHARGVVHRDIKPGNIVVCDEGQKVQILDFGIARLEEAARQSGDMMQTQVGTIVGTPRYMSPEQVMGKEIDRRSDLYSLGVVLYELLTGDRAFSAATLATLIHKITNEDLPALEKSGVDAPRGVQFILRKLLAKNPDKRYQSAAQLQAALDREIRGLQEREVHARKDRYLPFPVKVTALMAVATLVLMVIGSTIIYNRQVEAMRDQVIDAGVSLAKFIASESAIPVLSEEWYALEAAVEEATRRDTYEYLVITDFDGQVRAASEPSLVGQRYNGPDGGIARGTVDDVAVADLTGPRGDLLGFSAPISFQAQPIGTIYLGLSQAPLEQAAALTERMMLILAAVVVTAMSAITFLLARLFQHPIRVLNDALKQAQGGNFNFRISETRKDEFGTLFDSFNALAASMDQPDTPPSATDKPEPPCPEMIADDQPVADATVVAGSPPSLPDTAYADDQDGTVVAPAARPADPAVQADQARPEAETDPKSDTDDDQGDVRNVHAGGS